MTLTFARHSRATDAPRVALAAGAIGACTIMLVRVLVACAVLNPTLAASLPRYTGVAFIIGVVAVVSAWRTNTADGTGGGLDALTLSLARSTPPSDASATTAVALVAGILSNTLLKLAVALVIGRGWFRTATAAGLGAIALALAVALFMGR